MKFGMQQWIVIGLFVGLFWGPVGCDQANDTTPAPTKGTVAVVDLEAVARGLGKFSEWEEDLTREQESLRSELGNIEQRLTEQLQEARDQLSEDPTEEEQQRLQQGMLQARQILQNAEAQAASRLRQRRAELFNDFSDKLEPIARQVADAQGFDVVLVKGGDQLQIGGGVVMSVNAEADITQAVLTEARGSLSADNGGDDATDDSNGAADDDDRADDENGDSANGQ